MGFMNLGGNWRLTDADDVDASYDAPVPGCVHDALLAAGKIADVNFRSQERDALWVGERKWIYERGFLVSEEMLAEENLELVCDGLDTFATILVNGRELGRTDNMFRSYRFDVKNIVTPRDNSISIHFDPVPPYMREMSGSRHLPAWNEDTEAWDASLNRSWGYTGRGYVRKQACQFGWDWGPMTPSAGIWRDIRLEAWSTARIKDFRIRQEHHGNGGVDLLVSLAADTPVDLAAAASVCFDGALVAETAPATFHAEKTMRLSIPSPQLWWPSGLGDQPLYRLNIRLLDLRGNILDERVVRVGLRTVRLVRAPDEHGISMTFEVNGFKFFAKGSNFIPLDQYPSSRDLEPRLRRLLGDAREANMNMLRVWGGGYFQPDIFYDLCDELGICVWQDMMFGCGTYPTWDGHFLDNVFHEVLDNARRLRHHASLVCWCGNNELEQGFCAEDWTDKHMSWESYFELFARVIPSALALVDPDTPYIPGSPHSLGNERKNHGSPDSGDYHLWTVWFSEAPFEFYRNSPHRFLSEFGYQSFPEPRTIHSFTLPDDRAFDSEVMNLHQRSAPGNERILLQTRDWFGDKASFDNMCWLSQISHGLALKIGIEHWRRNWPRTAGATYWQINDCWPAPTWASIDCHGRWKAAHCMAKRFFAPVLVSALENADTANIAISLNNDLREPISGTVAAYLHMPCGRKLGEHQWDVEASPASVVKVADLNLDKMVPGGEAGDIITFLEFIPGSVDSPGQARDLNLVLLKRPRQIPLHSPRLTWQADPGEEGEFILEVFSDLPALWVKVELKNIDCRFSDNFFHLLPGIPAMIRARPGQPVSIADFRANLELADITAMAGINIPPAERSYLS